MNLYRFLVGFYSKENLIIEYFREINYFSMLNLIIIRTILTVLYTFQIILIITRDFMIILWI